MKLLARPLRWILLFLALVGLTGCGDDPPATAGTSVPTFPGDVGGATAAIGDGRFETAARIDANLSGDGTSLVVGHVELADPADADGLDARLRAGDTVLADAESSIVRTDDGVSLVVACLCRPPTEAGSLALQVRGSSGAVDVAGRSIVAVDGAEAADPVMSATDLPAPLVAATVEGDPPRLDADGAQLVEASLGSEVESGEPLLVIGTVLGERTTTDFGAAQIDAVADGERIQPSGTITTPSRQIGLYEMDAPEDGSIALVSATAAGSSPVQAASIFACACTVDD